MKRLVAQGLGLLTVVLLAAGCAQSPVKTIGASDAPDVPEIVDQLAPSITAAPTLAEPSPEHIFKSAAPNSGTSCPSSTKTVDSTLKLKTALEQAKAGDIIEMKRGTYKASFSLKAKGTKALPIYLCGSDQSVILGDDRAHGTGLHVEDSEYIHLVGFTVRGFQKGILLDTTRLSVIDAVKVENVGHEAIHLRANTTDTTVSNSVISGAGLATAKFGEGIYVGSAQSNWCDITDCKPDKSDRNVIKGNRIEGTTAEAIDLKEGTSEGRVEANIMDGTKITAADSWLDAKGNGWRIERNSGTESPGDGFQVHQILKGWGQNNVFIGNTLEVNGPGYGINVRSGAGDTGGSGNGNKVGCSNTVTGAKHGLSNLTCDERA